MNLSQKALALSVASAVVMMGCGKEEPPPPATPAPPPPLLVKIGHVAPLTGGIAHLGKDNENGAQLAIDEANAAGTKFGDRKVTFELMKEDDQADQKVGNTVAQKLVDAKVAGVIGHLNSGTTIPASAIYNGAGIPVISGSATNPKLTEQGFKGVFRVVGRDDQQGPAIANYLATQTKPKTVALIDDATEYGEGLANEVEKTLKAAGVKVLPREKGTDKTVDWKAVLTKIKGKNPDAVFYGGMDATGGPLIKQARELKMKALFAFGDGGCTDKMAELAGKEVAEGMLCSQAGVPVQAAGKKFLDAYNAKYKAAPILYSPFTYDATSLMIAAMKKAGSADPAKYLTELAQTDHNGATGNIKFDEKGDRKDAEMTIFTMKDGKITPIAIIKSGKSMTLDEYAALGAAPAAPAAAPDAASAAAPGTAPATAPAAGAPAAPAAAPATGTAPTNTTPTNPAPTNAASSAATPGAGAAASPAPATSPQGATTPPTAATAAPTKATTPATVGQSGQTSTPPAVANKPAAATATGSTQPAQQTSAASPTSPVAAPAVKKP